MDFKVPPLSFKGDSLPSLRGRSGKESSLLEQLQYAKFMDLREVMDTSEPR